MDMKIYQVHIRGGEWEDSYNYISNTYLDESKAKKEIEEYSKEKLIAKANFDKCGKCPVWSLTKRKYDKNPSLIGDYCDNFKLEISGNHISCGNYDYYDYDYINETISIEEIEVIE
jgi:hypothetical protein